MVRFRDGKPTGIYFSQHRDGAAYSWDDTTLSKRDGRVSALLCHARDIQCSHDSTSPSFTAPTARTQTIQPSGEQLFPLTMKHGHLPSPTETPPTTPPLLTGATQAPSGTPSSPPISYSSTRLTRPSFRSTRRPSLRTLPPPPSSTLQAAGETKSTPRPTPGRLKFLALGSRVFRPGRRVRGPSTLSGRGCILIRGG